MNKLLSKNIWFIVGLVLCLYMAVSTGCSKRVLPSTNISVIRVDSVITRIDTVYAELPKETVQVIRLDSSYLETSLAESWASVDSLGLLHHTLNNKETVLPIKTVVQDKISYRDSIQVKEVPVEVEKLVETIPKSFYYLLGWFILSVLGIGWIVYKHFRKI